MEKTPLISIILPVYNGEQYLEQSIESCLNQTYNNIELIIVNDCSTDNTLSIAKKYASKDPRVRVINNVTNKKLPASLNIGHDQAIGDYITWTSDDNYYDLDAIKTMLLTLQEKVVDVVYANYNQIKGDEQTIINLKDYSHLILSNTIGASFLYKHDVYKKSDRYNEALFLVEDYDFWLQCLKKNTFYHIDKALYNYRIHSTSLTKSIEKDNSRKQLFVKNVEKSYKNFFSGLGLDEEYCAKLFTKLHISPYLVKNKEEIFDIKKIINTCSKEFNFSKKNHNSLLVTISKMQLKLLRSINKQVNFYNCLRFLKMNYSLLTYKEYKTWVKLCLKLK